MIDYATRLAQAKAYSSRQPAADTPPQQKFKRGAFVKVTDEMPPWMSHFEKGFLGIVEYTYAQKYRCGNYNEYCLTQLDDAGKPINSLAWYDENQLTLVDDDLKAGVRIIEQYRASTGSCA